MHFTVIYRGRVPAGGEVRDITAMRTDPYLQAQFAALCTALRPLAAGKVELAIDNTLYESVLPLHWTSSIDILFVRANPPSGVRGLPDLDNAAKALLDGLCPPYGEGAPNPADGLSKLFCLALDDKQFVEVRLSQAHHWGSLDEKDNYAVITVKAARDPLDEIARFGSPSLTRVRNNALGPKGEA